MKLYVCLILGLSIGAAYGQYPSPPIGGWGSGSVNRPSSYPKQPPTASRPSPFSALASVLPGASSSSNHGPTSYDDPIPQIVHDSSYDTQTLPAKLPILAPNGVVEIYNRVVDDLIKRLELDFAKKEMDPMRVVIRPTPAGPVRVPGYLQRRPFRRPGAALYRGGNMPPQPQPHHQQPLHVAAGHLLKKKKKSRSNPVADTVSASAASSSGAESSRFPEGGRPSVTSSVAQSSDAAAPVTSQQATSGVEQKQSFRGAGKISKGPLNKNEDTVQETTPVPDSSEVIPSNITDDQDTQVGSSEEGPFIRARSDEYLPEDEMDDEDETKVPNGSIVSLKQKKTKKEDTAEEEDDEEKNEGKSTNVESLMQRYMDSNSADKTKNTKTKAKYSGGTKTKTEKTEKVKTTTKVTKSSEADDDEDDDDDDDAEQRDDPDMENVSYNIDAEPGAPHGGGRPQGGYYPQGGPPAIPAKPNAILAGLSKMRRSSDVAVSVDARSAMITARLLVGPIHVHVNESSEPKERGIKATIPELEAEMILMERHGVVFLQRFTLDRAYGQDVEISIPKVKGGDKKRKGSTKGNRPSQFDGPNGPNGPNGQNHPAAQDRFQTKMAAHISMEVVKLLRSGNLRVNLMRTAQGSMSKLKLPIQKPKTKKAKKEKKEETKEKSK